MSNSVVRRLDPDRDLSFVSSSGSPEKEIYHGELLKDGTIKLVLDRIDNTDALIQSFAESADIYNIIARVEAGDVGLLQQKQGYYFDAVGMPGTYAEVLNTVIRGQQLFEKLPADVRAEFNNDFNQWFAAMDQPDFALRSGFLWKPDDEKPLEKETKEE